MARASTWVLVGMLCIVATSVVAAAEPPSADRIEQARQGVLDERYQKDLPGEEDAPIGSGDDGSGSSFGSGRGGDGRDGHGMPNRWRRDRHGRLDGRGGELGGEDERDTRTESSDWNAGPLSSIFNALLWGVVIVGIGLLVFWLGSELLKYGGDDAQLAEPDGQAGASGVDLAVIQRPLGDAEELAARGEYREAIHTLLLRTLQELVRSAAVRVSPAMTSREILARVPVLADARTALAGLITAVEVTHFGDDEATLEDYVRCRNQFQVFATAFRKGAA